MSDNFPFLPLYSFCSDWQKVGMVRQAVGPGAVARANPVGSLEKKGLVSRLAQARAAIGFSVAQGPAAIPPQIRRPGCIGEDGIISNSRTTNRQAVWTNLNIFLGGVGGVVAHEGNLSRK